MSPAWLFGISHPSATFMVESIWLQFAKRVLHWAKQHWR
jgi:hypothetical protein